MFKNVSLTLISSESNTVYPFMSSKIPNSFAKTSLFLESLFPILISEE